MKNAIRTYREGLALSQIEMAKKIGVSAGFMHDLEKGRRKMSPQRALELEIDAGIPRHVLRPDIWPPLQSPVGDQVSSSK
jgi:DNA-binding XRE family transcriptional regulator